jgi:hypothetical protein
VKSARWGGIRENDGIQRFRQIVSAKGLALRSLDYEDLLAMGDRHTEELQLDNRRGSVSILVEPCDSEHVRVVVQGFLESWLPPLKRAALDGFYKYRDGSVTEMRDDEFYGYD